jgi:hypothetical protein
MPTNEKTFNAIQVMVLSDEDTEMLGAAYESGDHAELGRLFAHVVSEQLRKEDERWMLDIKQVLNAICPVPAFPTIRTPESKL